MRGWDDVSTEAVGGLIDEGHAVVVHAVVDVSHRGVLRLLTDAEHLDTGVLVSSHKLLCLFGQTVELLDLLHEDRLVGPAVTLLSGGVSQGLALLGVSNGIAHHTPAYRDILGVSSFIVSPQLGRVAGGLYCLETTSVGFRFIFSPILI